MKTDNGIYFQETFLALLKSTSSKPAIQHFSKIRSPITVFVQLL